MAIAGETRGRTVAGCPSLGPAVRLTWAIEFAKKIGVRYPLAMATDEVTKKFGGIEGLPTTLAYDRKGILRKKIIDLHTPIRLRRT